MALYITTPLYYVNDTPHIGHAYTTIVADVLRRYRRMFGEETLFLTGTDEHGQKVQNAAAKLGRDPQEYCNEVVLQFKNIWQELGIDYDIFYRTTDAFHKKAVQDCLQDLYDRDEIYVKEFVGWYSVSEEIFYTEKDLVAGKSPTGAEVTLVKEQNYFFKMSKYQDPLIAHIESHPEFIQPESKRNEVLGFLRKPLQDLCISRPKARLSWGIELPFDKDYVTYVWFDALLNYAVAVGLKRTGGDFPAILAKWWNPDSKSADTTGAVHLIGKDILTTHSVYWPTMLMALKAPLPKTIFAHGWWLTESNEKMSKSKGPTIKPLDMKNLVGIDGLRYFLTRDIHFGNDAQFSSQLVVNRVNTDLANNLGNLLSRSTNIIAKNFEGKIPKTDFSHPSTQALKQTAIAVAAKVHEEVLKFAPNRAVEHVTDMLTAANKYLEEMAPWKKVKEGQTELAAESLVAALECLRIAGILLWPVMPTKSEQMLKLVGAGELLTSAGGSGLDIARDVSGARNESALKQGSYSLNKNAFDSASLWGQLKPGTAIAKAEPLFPRVEFKEE